MAETKAKSKVEKSGHEQARPDLIDYNFPEHDKTFQAVDMADAQEQLKKYLKEKMQ